MYLPGEMRKSGDKFAAFYGGIDEIVQESGEVLWHAPAIIIKDKTLTSVTIRRGSKSIVRVNTFDEADVLTQKIRYYLAEQPVRKLVRDPVSGKRATQLVPYNLKIKVIDARLEHTVALSITAIPYTSAKSITADQALNHLFNLLSKPDNYENAVKELTEFGRDHPGQKLKIVNPRATHSFRFSYFDQDLHRRKWQNVGDVVILVKNLGELEIKETAVRKKRADAIELDPNVITWTGSVEDGPDVTLLYVAI